MPRLPTSPYPVPYTVNLSKAAKDRLERIEATRKVRKMDFIREAIDRLLDEMEALDAMAFGGIGLPPKRKT